MPKLLTTPKPKLILPGLPHHVPFKLNKLGELIEMVIMDIVDPHGHWRFGPMANLVVPHSSFYCAYFLPMPNAPRILTLKDLVLHMDNYERIIDNAGHDCTIMPCIMIDQVTDTPTTLAFVKRAFKWAKTNRKQLHWKIYFTGTTTGSHAAGVADLFKLLDILKCIRDLGGFVLVHFERPPPKYFQHRERDAVEWFWWIVEKVPGLRFVVEHITTPEMIRAVMDAPNNVRANITSQHIYDTLDIVLSTMANVHAHMKPPHGDPNAQTTLILTALSLLEKFGFGSDTAPHDRRMKECAEGCAGCFTAPFAILMIAEVLAKYLPPNMVPYIMQEFVSNRALRFYGLKNKGKVVKLVRKTFDIPAIYKGEGVDLIPYRAGHKLAWSYAEAA